MLVKKIEESTITQDDINQYKEKVSKLNGVVFNGLDAGMDKRIVTVRIGNIENELTLVNPTVVQVSDKPLVYFEKDTNKDKKVRKTIRYPWLVINTDNLGKVEFKAEKEEWKDAEEFFTDAGLLECVLVQRAIDSINGIDITDKSRAYSETITKDKKAGRNERIMLQGPNGEMEFVKNKKVDSYIQNGWQAI